ncbi:MAG: release factor glutamine methyltransferase [Crocinitomix sp.]|jgi:release factor glutamine methyltransferase
MFTSTNKLFDLLPYFKKKLGAHYPDREVENLFYWVCEDRFDLPKFQVRMEDKRLSESELLSMRAIVKRLEKHEPIQYILGSTEFYNCKIRVDINTLIPRPETEELVDWVLDNVSKENTVLDIGTGSGCIPIALKKAVNSLHVSGLDISAKAIELAKESAALNAVIVDFIQMDILNPDLSQLKKYDVIVSNPPYVLESDKKKMNENVLSYEPHLALFVADHEPLLFYTAIAKIGLEKLKPKGLLFFEIHEDFGKETIEMLEDLGYQNIEIRKDMQGKDRMIRCEYV